TGCKEDTRLGNQGRRRNGVLTHRLCRNGAIKPAAACPKETWPSQGGASCPAGRRAAIHSFMRALDEVRMGFRGPTVVWIMACSFNKEPAERRESPRSCEWAKTG